ncbi:MAG: hypothetical protein HN348_02415 [Proteobacteria bacterium]|nr:hypothetical protein [Pseudomonadota bacterium]
MQTRELRGMERVLVDLSDSMGPDVLVARLRGNMDVKRLEQAIAVVVARHPLLRASIVDGTMVGQPFDASKAKLHVVTNRHWQQVAEEQVGIPFDVSSGSLTRTTWIPDEEGGRLLFAAHHAVVDGHSLMRLLDELLQAYRADKPAYVVRHKLLPSAFEYLWLPLWMHWLAPLVRFVGLLAMRLTRHAPWTAALRPVPTPGTIATFAMGTCDGWHRLRSACRQNDVTVGGAFMAASWFAAAKLLAARGVNPLSDGYASIETPVSLRGRTTTPIPADAIGYFVSGVRPTVGVGPSTDFWRLARDLRTSQSVQLAWGVPAWVQLLADGMPDFRDQVAHAGVDLSATAGLASLVTVSNVGAYPHTPRVGDLELTEVYALDGISEGGTGLVTWLRMVGGRLCFNAIGSTALVDRNELEWVQGEIVRLLEYPDEIRGRRATETDSKHRFSVLESRATEPGGPGVNHEIGSLGEYFSGASDTRLAA